MSLPEPARSTADSEETGETIETESSEPGDNLNEVTGEAEEEDSKLGESGEDDCKEDAKITSVDNDGMDDACGFDSVDLQGSGQVKEPETGGDVLETKDADSDDLKTAGEKFEEDKTDEKVKTKGYKPGQQQKVQKTVSKSLEMEAVGAEDKTNTDTFVKGASKILEKEVLLSALNSGVSPESVVTVKTRNISVKLEPKSSRSSVSNLSDGESSVKSLTSVKSEPISVDFATTPKIPGIRTRLKTGSIHMNGTTTISVSKEKAEQENIMKQIAAKGEMGLGRE